MANHSAALPLHHYRETCLVIPRPARSGTGAHRVNVQRGLPGSSNSVDSQQTSETLKLVQRYAETIHIGVAHDSKDLLAKLSYEDRPQVFKKWKCG